MPLLQKYKIKLILLICTTLASKPTKIKVNIVRVNPDYVMYSRIAVENNEFDLH